MKNPWLRQQLLSYHHNHFQHYHKGGFNIIFLHLFFHGAANFLYQNCLIKVCYFNPMCAWATYSGVQMKQRQYFSIHTPLFVTQDVYITLMVLI